MNLTGAFALNPTIAIITNLEMEHTDCYKDLDDIENAFLQFCKSVPFLMGL